ncbi:MAG: indole-3-glycerol phosphate synthase TrpC, partial [Gammaproteobacteria bacterium]
MKDGADILERILAVKVEEVTARSAATPLAQLRARLQDLPATRGFRAALEGAIAGGDAGVIAEIKKASPSKGLLREVFDVSSIA